MQVRKAKAQSPSKRVQPSIVLRGSRDAGTGTLSHPRPRESPNCTRIALFAPCGELKGTPLSGTGTLEKSMQQPRSLNIHACQNRRRVAGCHSSRIERYSGDPSARGGSVFGAVLVTAIEMLLRSVYRRPSIPKAVSGLHAKLYLPTQLLYRPAEFCRPNLPTYSRGGKVGVPFLTT